MKYVIAISLYVLAMYPIWCILRVSAQADEAAPIRTPAAEWLEEHVK